MTLLFNTSGRPQVLCINPNCRKTHAVHRRGDYVKRSSVYVKCRACGTKWQLNEKEKQQLRDHYEQRQVELNEKNSGKSENSSNKEENLSQNKTEKTVKDTKKKVKDTPKKSWLDSLLD